MRCLSVLVAVVSAVLLTMLFWPVLWTGGGFIGGDIYSYFLPQKAWYADRLQAGEFPLWNSLAGHGYPLVGESQTGAFYPTNVLLYRVFDVNTAYNISHLLHVIGMFVVAFAYARRIHLSPMASLWVALVYSFGWFPARASLEWAIIGGFYFVWALWCAESFLQVARVRWLLLLSLGFGLHLLAGHFNLAWVTVVTLSGYVPARLMWSDGLSESLAAIRGNWRATLWLLTQFAGSIGLGFALAAVQLWPTWELKQLSQRLTPDMGFGHIPPLYLSQLVLPWMWYSPEVDTEKAIQALRAFSIDSATNKTEAHLYVGLMPWCCLVASVLLRRSRPATPRPLGKVWAVLCALSLLLATGALLPMIRFLPGFNFFSGLGRYGLIASFGVAILSGGALDNVTSALRTAWAKRVLIAMLFVLTVADLWIVAQWVSDAFPLSQPPVLVREHSEIRRVLAKANSQPVRVHAPGPNLPTLLGVSATPQYLGLAPLEYFDPTLVMPNGNTSDLRTIAAQVAWMQNSGVTHLLRFEPLDVNRWPVRLVWQGIDQVLHPAWGRSPQEPLFLYELQNAPGRVRFVTDRGSEPAPQHEAFITNYRANQVTIRVRSTHGGTVILTDLFYPGWEATIDGHPAKPKRADGMFRGIEVPSGEHTILWTFDPFSASRGAIVSGLAGIIWMVFVLRRGSCIVLAPGWLVDFKRR